MEKSRERLYSCINKYGLNYDKIIAADRDLHKEIINKQREMIKGENNVQ